MTADELRSYFNRVFGMEQEWPKTYEVDAVTYANCCQAVFSLHAKDDIAEYHTLRANKFPIWIGNETNGLMFKNVELILKS